MKQQMSEQLIETFLVMKRDEIERYRAEVADPETRDVTQWEHDEYIFNF
jgi:glutamine synthetase